MRGALAAILAAVLLLPAAASSRSGSTALRVADFSPFVVRGSGFRANERVRVVAQIEGRRVKTVVAKGTGAFAARFTGVSLRGCAAYVVRATGDKGSRAYLRHMNECPSE